MPAEASLLYSPSIFLQFDSGPAWDSEPVVLTWREQPLGAVTAPRSRLSFLSTVSFFSSLWAIDSSTPSSSMASHPAAVRRAHRGLPARPLKENLPCTIGWQHQHSAYKPTAKRPSSGHAELAHFSGFVRLLASKDEHQRAILVQRALQQVENVGSALSSGRFTADCRPSLDESKKGLRRASSADSLRRRPAVGWQPQSSNGARLLARRHEAALAQREVATFATTEHCRLSSPPEPPPPRVKDQAAALARRHKERARVCDAATVLQAHWRGRQHRRVVRFLRARRVRLCRLDWLDQLEYVRRLLSATGATSRIQAAWRAARVRRTLRADDARGHPSPLKPASRGSEDIQPLQMSCGEIISCGEISLSSAARRGGRPSVQWAAHLSETRTYEISDAWR